MNNPQPGPDEIKQHGPTMTPPTAMHPQRNALVDALKFYERIGRDGNEAALIEDGGRRASIAIATESTKSIQDQIDHKIDEILALEKNFVPMHETATALIGADAVKAKEMHARSIFAAIRALKTNPTTPKPTFRVEVRPMKESHQKTWWVCLIRSDCTDSIFSNAADGYITPFRSPHKEHAESEAADWRAFLGLPPQTGDASP